MKNTIICIVLLTSFLAYSQAKYTQKYIDTFQMRPITEERLLEFKNELDRNQAVRGLTKYYALKGYFYFRELEKDSAILYSQKAIKESELALVNSAYEKANLEKSYFVLGYYARLDGDYRMAVDHYKKGIAISEQVKELLGGESNYLPYFQRDIANCYIRLGYLTSAKRYYTELLQNSWYMSRGGWNIYNKLGLIAEYQEQQDSALFYYRQGLKLVKDEFNKSKDYEEYKATFYNNIGNVFRHQGVRDSALFYYHLVVNSGPYFKSERLPTRDLISNYYRKIAKAYIDLDQGKYQRALKDLNLVNDSIRVQFKDQNDRAIHDLKLAVIETMIEGYVEIGDYRSGFDLLNTKNELNLLLNRQLLKENLEELETVYKVQEKEQEIIELEAIQAFQDKNLNQRMTIIYLLIGLLVIGSLSGYLLFRQRELKNKYQAVNLKQKLLQIQLNPHFIFNTLNSIHNLVIKDAPKAENYILKFTELLRLILQNSREEFIPLSEEITAIENYMALQSNFSKRFEYSLDPDFDQSTEDLLVPPMFIQPFIENTIEHGFQSEENNKIIVKLSVDKKQDILHCTITDNGVGYFSTITNKDKKKYRSLSGQILAERIKLYAKSFKTNANYSIDYANKELQKGTRVKISIPYIRDE